MRDYLVGYSVIASSGTYVSRTFVETDLKGGEVITETVITGWEHQILRSYDNTDLDVKTIRVFSFTEM
jgi:hypothetical protein